MAPVSHKTYAAQYSDGVRLRNPVFGLRAIIDYLFFIYEFQNEFAIDIDCDPKP
jgi:hypothetical protein